MRYSIIKSFFTIFFLLISSVPVYSQFNVILKKIGIEITEEGLEKSAKSGVKTYSRNSVEHAVVNHELKKEIRLRLRNQLEKEGVKSFFEYGTRKIIPKVSKTGVSLIKKQMATSEYTSFLRGKVRNDRSILMVENFKSGYLKSKLVKSQIQKDLDHILSKGPISLTDKELNELLTHPEYFREFVRVKTGSSSGGLNNMQEFFIRLSIRNKDQVKMILENSQIKTKVNKTIRNGGGKHEWLMTKNFEDFLLNPKWNKDGPFLALALTKLVQRTEAVIFKYGGSHLSKVNSGKFHNGLSNVISQCASKEELFISVKKYAKQNLNKESYKDFCILFKEIFGTNSIII